MICRVIFYHVILQDQVTKDVSNYGLKLLKVITNLASLVAIDTLVLEI